MKQGALSPGGLWGECLSERLPAVLPPVLGINLLEVISSRPNVVERSSRGILASIVVLLPQQHGFHVLLARHNLHVRQPVHEVQLLPDIRGIALDSHGVEGGSESGSVSEHGDLLALQDVGVDAGEDRGETTVQGGGVHITATFRAPHRRLHALCVLGLANANEGLLDDLIG